MIGLVLLQLLSLLFGIQPMNMLSQQIAQFISVTIWKLTFSDLPKFPLHLIICWWTFHCTWTMNLSNPCTWCATELDYFRGYWRNRPFKLLSLLLCRSTHIHTHAHARAHTHTHTHTHTYIYIYIYIYIYLWHDSHCSRWFRWPRHAGSSLLLYVKLYPIV